LTDSQKLFVLADRVTLAQLHTQVSTSPAAHPSWHTAPVGDHQRADGAMLDAAS
jgi:hypothetical protein